MDRAAGGTNLNAVWTNSAVRSTSEIASGPSFADLLSRYPEDQGGGDTAVIDYQYGDYDEAG